MVTPFRSARRGIFPFPLTLLIDRVQGHHLISSFPFRFMEVGWRKLWRHIIMQLVLLFWRQFWRPTVFTNEEDKWSCHTEMQLYTHVLLELFYAATHKMKATPFCCSTLVVFKNYTSEGTMCLSHPTPCTHTPSREHTASQYHGKGHWKHKVKREGEGSQSISALYMSFHKVKCSKTCSDTLKVRPLANKRKKKDPKSSVSTILSPHGIWTPTLSFNSWWCLTSSTEDYHVLNI